MKELRFSTMGDEWEQTSANTFVSPLNKSAPEQIVIFSDQMKNGAIQVSVTPLEGSMSARGEKGKESAVVFRYSGYEGYYYAGVGAFRTKFFIAKVLPGPVWQLLGATGTREAVKYNQTYHLRVECVGNQLTLFENDVRQLVVFDESYRTGQWGLRSWRSKAQFENVNVEFSQPVSFVVMPFASELAFVYDVIKDTTQEFGLHCIRADEVLVSRPVVEDVKQQIAEADVVIVDFTGKNPNVYYEAGLADAWKKKWIVLAQSSDDLTFDVRHIRTILYSNTMGADIQLKARLRQAIVETTGLRPKVEVQTEGTRV